MKTEKINLSQVVVNKANPRTISDTKFAKLIDSILNFPKMLELRPIVIDETNTALGGNMRLRALNAIAGMPQAEFTARLNASRDYQSKTQPERDALLSYWETWQTAPTAIVTYASELTDTEKRSFIIKDNASFGNWDWDALANEWDADELSDWGVDEWRDEPQATTFDGATQDDNLPEELAGLDLDADPLENLQGDDDVAMARIIIVYPKEREQELAQILGLDSINNKVVFHIDEIVEPK